MKADQLLEVPGFRFAGVPAGIKASGRPDVALVVADAPCTAAGVFTQNRFAAPPVGVSRERVKNGRLRGVIVNSGNANACTGPKGKADAIAMTRLAAQAAGSGTHADDLAVASTGIIGVPLPMDAVRRGIAAAGASLDAKGFHRFAEAILTTDQGPKIHVVRTKLGRREITVAGCAKGAGMIAPNMATTLAFVFTDAAARGPWLRRLLAEEVTGTFNSVSVDGDTSTNDSLFVLASGVVGNPAVSSDDAAGKRLRAAVREVLLELARALVRDGEGATKLVKISVAGAKSDEAARLVARRIASSPLVKTAFFGADPNWGRILGAVGNAGVPFDPARVDLDLDDVALVRRGVGVVAPDVQERGHEVMARPEFTVRVDLHGGRGKADFWTCDLGHAYVSCNADYST